MAHTLRCLFFVEAYYDLSLAATHISGVENRAADCISCNNLDEFFSFYPQAQCQPVSVPPGLVRQLILPKERQAVDLQRLESLARELVSGSLAPSTKRVYTSGQH